MKKLIAIIVLIMLGASLLGLPQALAEIGPPPLPPNTLHVKLEDTRTPHALFDGVNVEIWQVANGDWDLIDDFADWGTYLPGDIFDDANTEALIEVTEALEAIARDGAPRLGNSISDHGIADFVGLFDGVYLVIVEDVPASILNEPGATHVYQSMLVPLPLWVNDTRNTAVTAIPKGEYTPYEEPVGNLVLTKTFTQGITAPENLRFVITGPSPSTEETVVYYNSFSGNTVTIPLATGTYTVTEEGYDVNGYNWVPVYKVNTVVTGGDPVAVSISTGGTTNLEIANNYTPKVGSLKIQKIFSAQSPARPAGFDLAFRVTGPYGYDETFAFSDFTNTALTISNLREGQYTVTELNGNISGYSYSAAYSVDGGTSTSGSAATLNVSEGNTDNEPALVVFTNTYTRDMGNLIIRKVISPSSITTLPDSFNPTFTVSGPAGFTETTIRYRDFNGSGQHTFSNIPTGTYTVTESTSDRNITGYTFSTVAVTGDGNVTKGQTATLTVTNTYTPPTSSSPPPTSSSPPPSSSSPPPESSSPPPESSSPPPESSSPPPYIPPPYIPPPVVIPPPPVPTGEMNSLVEDGDGWLEFDEDGVPLGRWELDPETGEWIFDAFPPLGEMPQTGVLRWPIPWLSGTGTLLIGFGCVINRKGKRYNAR